MNGAEPEYLERHARHLSDTVLIVDNKNLDSYCARHSMYSSGPRRFDAAAIFYANSVQRGRRRFHGDGVSDWRIDRHVGQFLDVENEGDASVAENRRGGDARDRAVAFLDALDHHLLMACLLYTSD